MKKLKKTKARGFALLSAYMEKRELSLLQLSRDLDISWVTARKISLGWTKPTLDQAFLMEEQMKIPVSSWKGELMT